MIPGYFILKVAGHCNLACNYCFAQSGFNGSLMEPEILAQVFCQIDELGLERPKVSWHGGEPTLLGLDGFKSGLEVQTGLNSQFRNSIQTNATLLDGSWIDLFRDHHFGVGVSIDGPKEVHDLNRPTHNGEGSFERTMRGLKLLLESGMSVGIISVISRYVNPEDYFDFVRGLGVSSFDMKPCVSEWEGAIHLEDFTTFQRKVFGMWLENDDPGLNSRAFTGYAENCLGGTGSLCSLSGNCGHFVTIDTNGDVYPCDELILPQFRLGNITERPLRQILSGPTRTCFEEMLNTHQAECSESCDAYQVCRGGCTSARLHYGQSRTCTHLKATSRMVQEWVEQIEGR